jgi:ribose transport system ATP-binding protein
MSASNIGTVSEAKAATVQPIDLARPALVLRGITKAYPGVRALIAVDIDVRPGEIHGLVGENGAGKSTLVGVAAGTVEPDEGEVWIGGRELDRASPSLARSLGLAIVHQEPALMPDLTVAENLALGQAPEQRPGWGAAPNWAEEALLAWTSSRAIDPTWVMRDLGPDTRFIVELSKAFAQSPHVLILDEPTEHLAADDVATLFAQLRSVAASGTAVVYISHRIPEVLEICDRISVLRDGVMRGMLEAEHTTHDEIVTNIIGRTLDAEFPAKRPADRPLGEPVLAASGLRGERFSDVSFDVYPGEIIGLAGVEGNGQRELIRALAGLVPSKGQVTVGGAKVPLGNAPGASGKGLAFVPNDRHREGIFTGLGVRENMAIGNLGAYARLGVVQPRRERDAIAARIDGLDIQTPTIDTRINSLSGGNQQKTVFGRILEQRPKVILADEPTQGVDVGARAEIYTLIRDAVSSGGAAVVHSSDHIELEGLCDRVLVLSRGNVVRELSGPEVTEQAMVEAALTATASREGAAKARGTSRLMRFLRGDLAPPAITLAVAAALGAYTSTQNGFFLTGHAFTGILLAFAALAFASMAQQVVMMVGGIDLSVGPLMGFLVVVASFVITPGTSAGGLALGWLLLIGIACAVAIVNFGPTLLRIPPLLTTLVTFTALQGLSLLLRPQPGGQIDPTVLSTLASQVGFVPWAAIVAVVLGLALDYAMRRTSWGVALRGVGSATDHAHAVGVRVRLVQLSAYLLAGLLVFLASLMLMNQVGAGDPTAGVSYTLYSITAVVVGGASITGGRGAFVGALAGAFLIVLVNSAVTFLNLNTAWQTYMVGILTLVAAGIYSRLRSANV